MEGYRSVGMNFIIRNGNYIPIILFNILYIPKIITNLISIQKLDLKKIYWRLDNQTLRIVKINKEVGFSRIVSE